MKYQMKTVFVMVSVSRAAGGLLPSVRSLAKSLIHFSNLQIEVLGLRDEFTNQDVMNWNSIQPKVFDTSFPKLAAYAPKLKRYLFNQLELDIAHIHSVWLYPSWAVSQWARRMHKPYIVTTHGMLDPWALRNSQWRKRIIGLLYANANLRSAACIHALCVSEYKSIRAYGLKNPVCIIPNGIDLPNLKAGQKVKPPWESRVDTEKKMMLFLGRIHPKKGLLNLLKAWSKVKPKEWILVIAGWDQGGHENQLKKLVAELGLTEDVIFLGPVFDDLKQACLQNANAFILPSFSEGLPMAVLEAWSYGLPVLMTRFCNIPEGFKSNAAIEIQTEPDSIAEMLKEFFNLHEGARKQIGQNGLELVKNKFTWSKIASQMVDVYKWVLGQSPKPECVRMD